MRDVAPWGEASFKRDRNWYAHLSSNSEDWMNTKQEYQKRRERALGDPTYDLFDNFMPTGRPKHDIGRYVLRYGIDVPLITSMAEWQAAILDGTAMLRSELLQDYDGYSGLLSSMVIPRKSEYPLGQNGLPGVRYRWNEPPEQIVEGPIHTYTDLSDIDLLNPHPDRAIGSEDVRSLFHQQLANGLYDGTVNPAAIMRLMRWNKEREEHYLDAALYGFSPAPLGDARVSRWRYIPGVNVRIFRDPVIEGKYFIGGRKAHHHWEITDGRDSPDMDAHDKAVYRGRREPGQPEYTLPTAPLIDIYEKIRTLPYLDHRQAFVAELKYGNDGRYRFLQYLKTGILLGDPGEFELPTSRTSVMVHDVRGATTPEGEKLRLYIDPERMPRGIEGQGVLARSRLGHREHLAQAIVMASRVAITYALNFKDNHFSSSLLTRPLVALGLWDGVGDAEERFSRLALQQPQRRYRSDIRNYPVEYIEAHVTSNGRKAVIDSDWELHTE